MPDPVVVPAPAGGGAVSQSGVPPAGGSVQGPPSKRPAMVFAQQVLFRYGLVVAYVVMLIIFSALKPHVFPTLENLRAVLEECAPTGIMAIGLTAVLVMKDFDLSFASMLGLGSGLVTILIVNHHMGWVAAVILCL